MKLIDLRKSLKEQFIQHNIDTIDVDYIISSVLGVSVTELVFTDEIDKKTFKQIDKYIQQRLKHKPVDKIFKTAYFYGEKYYVNNAVLTPRQDSEILIDEVIKIAEKKHYKTALDLCTGSGALAIAIKKNTTLDVTASDVSKKALKVAKKNAKLLSADIKFVHSNMFKNIKGKFDLIVSNPPYIETEIIKKLDDEVKNFDPILALDGGQDGLDFYRIISKNIKTHLNNFGTIILEIGDTQKQAVIDIFKDFSFCDCIKDFGGNDRVLIFEYKE